MDGKQNAELGVHTDDELAALVQSGNADAFVELTARYMELVRAKASPLRCDLLDDDDLCQEGLLGLYHAACTYLPEHGARFFTYAGTCIHNQILTAYRRVHGKRRVPPNGFVSLAEDAVPDVSASEVDNPEVVLLAQERLLAVQRSIEQCLTQMEQKVLMLYLSGCSYAKIADMLQVTPKAVDNALRRVRLKLKKIS